MVLKGFATKNLTKLQLKAKQEGIKHEGLHDYNY